MPPLQRQLCSKQLVQQRASNTVRGSRAMPGPFECSSQACAGSCGTGVAPKELSRLVLELSASGSCLLHASARLWTRSVWVPDRELRTEMENV